MLIIYLYRLGVVQVFAEVHKNLGHEFRYIIRKRLHTCSQAQDARMPSDQFTSNGRVSLEGCLKRERGKKGGLTYLQDY